MTDTFSIDEAVASITASEADNPQDAVVVDAVDADAALEGDEVNDIPGDQPGSEEAAETPAEDAGGDDDAPAKEPAAEAPAHWSAEGKAFFASLTPEAQQVILAEAEAATRVTSKKLEETAAERKAAKAEREQFLALRERVASAAERAQNAFASKWEGITPEAWAELARTKPQEYAALKAQHDADQHAHQQVQSARLEVEAEAHADWLQEQREALQTLAPELVAPETGDKKLEELGDWLVTQGVERKNLPNVGALEMSIAYDAMRYRQGLSKLTKPTPPAPSKPAIKPSAAATSTPQQRTAAAAQARLSKTGSIDDAVALLLAKGN